MVNVLLVQSISTGFPGAPGYTTFAFEHGAGASVDLQFGNSRDFWVQNSGNFPVVWSCSLAAEHRVVDEVTGELVDIIPVSPAGMGAAVAGTSGVGFGAGVAGGVVSWRTLTNNRGRRVRGRTFLVPMRAAAYQGDGTLVDGLASDIAGNATDALLTPLNDFGIWSRPRAGVGGKFAPATGVSVPDKVSYLRSRRD